VSVIIPVIPKVMRWAAQSESAPGEAAARIKDDVSVIRA
jgi:hypothetical protein